MSDSFDAVFNFGGFIPKALGIESKGIPESAVV